MNEKNIKNITAEITPEIQEAVDLQVRRMIELANHFTHITDVSDFELLKNAGYTGEEIDRALQLYLNVREAYGRQLDRKEDVISRLADGATEAELLEAGYTMSDIREGMQEYRRQAHDKEALPMITASHLFQKTFPYKKPIIEGLLYPGVYLFAGAPKIGKSFLMAQIAYHVSKGLPLWGRAVGQSRVAYYALEDTEESLQKRLYRMFGVAQSGLLNLCFEARTLKNGLMDALKWLMLDYEDTRLVIIDTLQMIRGAENEKQSYAQDYQTIRILKEFADKHNVCLLLVHHMRKQGAEDSYNMISGTNGLFGAADGAFVLRKENRAENAATLEITGRRQQDQKFTLMKNMRTLAWELESEETTFEKPPKEPLLEKIAQWLMEELPKQHWAGTASELADALHITEKPNRLTRKLNVLQGRLQEEYNVYYETARDRKKRYIALAYMPPEESVVVDDDEDDEEAENEQ